MATQCLFPYWQANMQRMSFLYLFSLEFAIQNYFLDE